jgi:hypothetical protein
LFGLLESKISKSQSTFWWVRCHVADQVTTHRAYDYEDSAHQSLADLAVSYLVLFDGVIDIKRIAFIGLFCFIR